MELTTLLASNPVNIIESVDAEELEYQLMLVAKFKKAVAEIRVLIEDDENLPICIYPTSFGKDSYTQLLIGLEAYRQSIAEGKIEPTRPLLVSNVNTGVESLPMVMFVRYASKHLQSYAKEHNINLYFDIVMPEFMDEYFIRWASGQKLIPSPTRHGDCSVILKVEPSEKYAAEVMERIIAEPKMSKYVNSARITCVGSRDDESLRRSSNIRKQNLDVNSSEVKQLLELLDNSKQSKPTYKFAPIREWLTSEVFDFIALGGKSPVTRSLIKDNPSPIPSFLSSGALLLEIYGNGTNEVCELVVGSKNQGAGCNGKSSRFGCFVCTMSENDKSSTAISEYERWRVLGSEYALRVRDYLFRLGHDNSKRALHARAYDPVTYNRVLLQPNVLKSKYLEKLVWYASQLTQYSQKISSHFSELVKQGREQEFSGYRDIMDDPYMNPQAKAEFLEMYIQEAQHPLIECFSERHATMLSVRWCLDGINSAPYRPLAIWFKVKNGESLPWPKTMAEREQTAGKFVMDKELPDAMALPIIKEDKFTPESFAAAEMDLYSLFSMPTHYSQIFEMDMNCSMETKISNSEEITIDIDVKLNIANEKCLDTIGALTAHDINGVEFPTQYINLESLEILKGRINGRTISPSLMNYIQKDVQKEVERQLVEMSSGLELNLDQKSFSEMESALRFAQKGIQAIENLKSVKVYLPFLKFTKTGTLVPRQRPVNVERKFASTLRVVKRESGKIVHTNTRMRTYPVNHSPKFEQSQLIEIIRLNVNFNTVNHYTLALEDDPSRYTSEITSLSNLSFNEEIYQNWRATGGMRRALELHDREIEHWIKYRRDVKSYNFRRFKNTHVAEHMFREGGLSVQKAYYKQLTAILQRTHLFAEIGAFNFANMSVNQLTKAGVCKSMKEHRQDKAEVLLEIRKIRNSRRQTARHLVNANELAVPVINELEQFFHQLGVAMELSLKLGMEGRLKCVFFDSEVSLISRGNAYRAWLRNYGDVFADLNSMLQNLFGRNLFSQLQASNQLLPIARNLAASLMPVIDEGKRRVSNYRTILEKIDTLKSEYISNDDLDVHWLRNKWAELMTEIHQDSNEYLAFFPESKRNEENLWKLLLENIDFLNTECLYQERLLDSCQQMIDKAAQSAMKKLSLSDRLSAMSKLTRMVA